MCADRTRLLDDGDDLDEHPMITFRDGPAGRRAGLVGGPDVWEVVLALLDFADENVADFALLAGELLVVGGAHHAGVLIALSSRFSRRRSGIEAIVAAVTAVARSHSRTG